MKASNPRRGTIIPLLSLTIVGLFGFLALAIDLGMLTVARTQCQATADASALAGARMLNNQDYNNNYDAAMTAALNSVSANTVLSTQLVSNGSGSNVSSIRIGTYEYNTATQTFSSAFPSTLPSNTSWSSVEVNLAFDNAAFFAKIFGVQTLPTGANAVAVHRPRDIAIVLDYSASMRFGSITHWRDGWSNTNEECQGLLNPDPDYPQFGHYSRYTEYNQNYIPTASDVTAATASTVPVSQRPHPLSNTQTYTTGGNNILGCANHTIETNSGPPIVLDFRFNPANINNPSTPVSASTSMWNAFNRWLTNTPTDTPNTALAPAQQGNAFAYSDYRPPVIDTSYPGTPNRFVQRTFSWAGYNPLDNTGSCGPTPAPDFFATQSSGTGDSSNVGYSGDLWPRQGGIRATTTQSWLVNMTGGTAVNCADLLNWSPSYNGQPPTRGTQSGTGSTLRYGISANPSTPDYNADWSDFRDATFERYGYDLNIANYTRQRPSNWDPRWDWDINTGTWKHIRKTDPDSTITFRPKLLPVDQRFQGYSMGPGYWGKTFFIWPPDPRTPVDTSTGTVVPGDWRLRFFNNTTGKNASQGLLKSSNGFTLSNVSGTSVNYQNVLKWIKSGPQTLPPNLRAGRIVYYQSIPDNVTNTSDMDQVFWKNYIDFVLGQGTYSPLCNGAGVEYVSWPEGSTITLGTTTGFVHKLSGVTPSSDPAAYMNYIDNPNRPRTNFWFGPLTMLHFIYARLPSPNRNWAAGTVHEAQCWQLKAAINSCIEDIRVNHPNDCAGLAYFAYLNFVNPRCEMGQNWKKLQNALYYPYSLLATSTNQSAGILDPTKELRPYDAKCNSTLVGDLPNAIGGTDPNTGMAQAYNLLSTSSNLSGSSGYSSLGRKGAAKIVIFETDGLPTSTAPWTLTGSGSNKYYQQSGTSLTWSGEERNGITLGTTVAGTPLSNDALAALAVVSQIVKQTDQGGFSTPNSPARVYGIAFGDMFDGYNGTLASLGGQTQAISGINFLLRLQQVGGTSTWSDAATLPVSNVITGPYSTRIDNLQRILSQIMQSGVQVTLIQ